MPSLRPARPGSSVHEGSHSGIGGRSSFFDTGPYGCSRGYHFVPFGQFQERSRCQDIDIGVHVAIGDPVRHLSVFIDDDRLQLGRVDRLNQTLYDRGLAPILRAIVGIDLERRLEHTSRLRSALAAMPSVREEQISFLYHQ